MSLQRSKSVVQGVALMSWEVNMSQLPCTLAPGSNPLTGTCGWGCLQALPPGGCQRWTLHTGLLGGRCKLCRPIASAMLLLLRLLVVQVLLSVVWLLRLEHGALLLGARIGRHEKPGGPWPRGCRH